LLDLDGIPLPGEAEAKTHARNVGVDDDAFVLSKRIAKNDVRRLTPDSGEFDELLHRVRDCSVVPLDQSLAEPDDALRLVAEKSGALDDLLQFFRRRIGERRSRWESLKEQWSHHVHTLVGA